MGKQTTCPRERGHGSHYCGWHSWSSGCSGEWIPAGAGMTGGGGAGGGVGEGIYLWAGKQHAHVNVGQAAIGV